MEEGALVSEGLGGVPHRKLTRTPANSPCSDLQVSVSAIPVSFVGHHPVIDQGSDD